VDAGSLHGIVELFGHFILIIGYETDSLVYHDPDMGPARQASNRTLFTAWNRFGLQGVSLWKPPRR
jgi:uncharacterized protein YvpB